MKDFARRRQIDSEVWTKVDAWNIGSSNFSR